MANVIYRGPIKDQPETVANKTVGGPYLPGVLVTVMDKDFFLASEFDIEKDILILSNAAFAGQDVSTAYTAGDTGVAYRPRPGEIYQVRMAVEAYFEGTPLTVGASGYLEPAQPGERVFAFYEGIDDAVLEGDLRDVRIANSFNLA
jgi:hypothetical protein